MKLIGKWFRRLILMLVVLMLGPLAMTASGEVNVAADWSTASRESTGLAPRAEDTREAVVQVYAARTFGWRGTLAVHTWVAVKPEGAASYTTYEVIGWRAFHGGSAVNSHNGDPDRKWFGAMPDVLVDLRGEKAAKAIPAIEQAVKDYPYQNEYRTWPGPNSNTFTAHIGRNVPALALDLPPTAIGKDFIPGGAPMATSPSGTGIQISVLGLFGVIVAIEEGIEVNVLGLSFGIDPKSFAIKLPGVGVIGP
jgi:hypothetical protein